MVPFPMYFGTDACYAPSFSFQKVNMKIEADKTRELNDKSSISITVTYNQHTGGHSLSKNRTVQVSKALDKVKYQVIDLADLQTGDCILKDNCNTEKCVMSTADTMNSKLKTEDLTLLWDVYNGEQYSQALLLFLCIAH